MPWGSPPQKLCMLASICMRGTRGATEESPLSHCHIYTCTKSHSLVCISNSNLNMALCYFLGLFSQSTHSCFAAAYLYCGSASFPKVFIWSLSLLCSSFSQSQMCLFTQQCYESTAITPILEQRTQDMGLSGFRQRQANIWLSLIAVTLRYLNGTKMSIPKEPFLLHVGDGGARIQPSSHCLMLLYHLRDTLRGETAY